MSPRSTIEWTDDHWEPVGGCSRVSIGCENCYAERLIGTRLASNQGTRGRYYGLTRPTIDGPRFTGAMACWPDRFDEPLRRRKPTRYFVCSQSDLFHSERPLPDIAAVLGVCVAAGWHTLMLLTKRPDVMRHVLAEYTPSRAVQAAWDIQRNLGASVRSERLLNVAMLKASGKGWQDLAHIWCGVSAENQETFDMRWPELRQVPAALHFVSYEPACGPLDIATWMHSDMTSDGRCGLRWIIAGCESGPGARPAPLEWVRSVRDQVLAARGGREVPQPGDPHLFVKQWDICTMCDGQWTNDAMPTGCWECPTNAPKGQTGNVRKGCPALDGRVWAEVPEVQR